MGELEQALCVMSNITKHLQFNGGRHRGRYLAKRAISIPAEILSFDWASKIALDLSFDKSKLSMFTKLNKVEQGTILLSSTLFPL